MLTLDPGTMAGMTDEHLLSSLHGEHLTPCERELLKRWECALRELDTRKRVDDLAQCIHNQSEYGRSELREILNGR